MEITQEYLDKSFNDLSEKIDRKLEAQTSELKAFAQAQTEELARIIAETVANPLQEHLAQSEKKNKQIAAVFAETL